ncbi:MULTISPECIES: MarR family transcriptional regulator [unclassified Photobacterium]|uniref:MarR family transcriptional regulator n=1 Tax=unclassified Photobacterium TaxID=2628852 RepID=UPI000D15A0F5|nr:MULTISPECIES: MarR family transcriptional regulator [unclassified Photobacterium]PSV29111.1 MarR family transcriptional regulator [Photobacterium sp. GB-56]PSV33034.1 MarR family transcriptional regulator [Photobacterium sp. GB-72]PSV36397.1 MarR family transcriptional regulator [Photobacterium sp. GB-27]PSV41005.1 MarR family transcriptional regulator [Photobacterium sp. GB-210]PSV47895.1 MarR family transcriptional regulator [Photobacterium sp. GB-36]
MRISHKRKVQLKLQKQTPVFAELATKAAPKKAAKQAPSVETVKAAPAAKAVEAKKEVKPTPAKATTAVSLTPKQQQVLDIVVKNAEGLNPKGIGLEAGQEDAKAASWATGALKKLTEEGLVERIQLAGNKVLYKAL